MKVAYLIGVHNQPEYMAMLIQALDCDGAHFFVHVDLKSDIEAFRRAVPDLPNLTFLSGGDRVPVYWGGFSQVQASLNLIEAACKADVPFSRYCLLSGADFPIKPLARIRQVLSTATEFMSVDRKLAQDDASGRAVAKHIQRFTRRYYWRDRPGVLWQLASGWIPRKTAPPLPIYHGSQWWALSHECIAFIRDFLLAHPGYADFFKHTNCPVEMFFQSIVKASPFAERISHDFERNERVGTLERAIAIPSSHLYGCHYIDWSTRARSPKTLELSDLNALLQSQALFARKFQKNHSDELVEALLERLDLSLAPVCPGVLNT